MRNEIKEEEGKLEINTKQLLSFDEKNKARILKLIALGAINYRESNK